VRRHWHALHEFTRLMAVGLVAFAAESASGGSADPLWFLPQQVFDGGTGPGGVDAADFNGDGRLDLAITNSNAGSVSVLFGTTIPGSSIVAFAVRASFSTGDSPVSLSTMDVNGDGRSDLVVANYVGDNVSVLLNTTDPCATVPSFASGQTFATGSFPIAMTMTDVNGDEKSDIVAANYGDGTLSVLVNLTASGATKAAFAMQNVFPAGSNPFSVTSADINTDGRPDLVVASGDVASVLLNTTPPGAMEPEFAPEETITSGSFLIAVAAADFNDDGLADLVIADSYEDVVSVLVNATSPGAGAAVFAPPQIFAVGDQAEAVIAADVDLDGRPDIVAANTFDGTASVLVNRTIGGASVLDFAEQTHWSTGAAPDALAVADINGDGRLDLITANYADATASVLLNGGHHIFANGFDLAEGRRAIAAPYCVKREIESRFVNPGIRASRGRGAD
jgi:hypothetical protein